MTEIRKYCVFFLYSFLENIKNMYLKRKKGKILKNVPLIFSNNKWTLIGVRHPLEDCYIYLTNMKKQREKNSVYTKSHVE